MKTMANSKFFPFQSLYKTLQIFCWCDTHDLFSLKLLSVDPNNDHTTKK